MTSYLFPIILLLLVLVWLFRSRIFKKDKGLNAGTRQQLSIDDRYNMHRREQEDELDDLLEKISKNGLDSLSHKEQERLRELSQK